MEVAFGSSLNSVWKNRHLENDERKIILKWI
jgi:hypothetical protein